MPDEEFEVVPLEKELSGIESKDDELNIIEF